MNKQRLWKSFLLEQLFICIMGIIAFIVFLIIRFVKKDVVYFYLAIGTLGLCLLWIGGQALLYYLKNKKKKEEEQC